MSENAISLESASIHHLQTSILHLMKPLDAGFSGVSLALGKKDTAWNPEGGQYRGPAGLQYVLHEASGTVTAYDDDELQF